MRIMKYPTRHPTIQRIIMQEMASGTIIYLGNRVPSTRRRRSTRRLLYYPLLSLTLV